MQPRAERVAERHWSPMQRPPRPNPATQPARSAV